MLRVKDRLKFKVRVSVSVKIRFVFGFGVWLRVWKRYIFRGRFGVC